jgi:hypothetical protein
VTGAVVGAAAGWVEAWGGSAGFGADCTGAASEDFVTGSLEEAANTVAGVLVAEVPAIAPPAAVVGCGAGVGVEVEAGTPAGAAGG